MHGFCVRAEGIFVMELKLREQRFCSQNTGMLHPWKIAGQNKANIKMQPLCEMQKIRSIVDFMKHYYATDSGQPVLSEQDNVDFFLIISGNIVPC